MDYSLKLIIDNLYYYIIIYIIMNNNTNNTNTIIVSIYREDDKLSVLEYILNQNPYLETLVSNYIDYSIQQQYNLANENCNELNKIINNTQLFNKIIQISQSIIHETPYKLTIVNNEHSAKLIAYLKKPFIDFIY